MTKEEFLFEKERLLNLRPFEVVNHQMDIDTFSGDGCPPKANTLTKLQLLIEFGACLGEDNFFGYGDDDSFIESTKIYINEYFTDISVNTINKALLWVNAHFYDLDLNKMSKWLTATRKISNLIHTKKWNKKTEQQLYSYFMVRTSWAFDDYRLLNESEEGFISKESHLFMFSELKPESIQDKERDDEPQINIKDILTKDDKKDTYAVNIKELIKLNKFGLINSITVSEIETTGWYEVFFSIQDVSDIRLITQRNESRKYKNLTRLLNLLKTHCNTVPYINFSNKK